MYFDRYDILEAYYTFLSEYHEGQGSEKYARLCKLLLYFKPSRMFRASTMSLNAYEIYTNLVVKEQQNEA